ncbi:MAG TPA: LysR family transcriptional regulator [Anaerolineae bacterium]|nr:LysR family transcriptional regulator [Anaerolineae bacterium]
MNLQQLRTLIAIADEGGLSAAGRALRISQPAVTKQLQRLEQELGATLLLRSSQRPGALTPSGERVLAFARDTLEGIDRLREQLALLREVTPGSLTLAASTIPGEHLLPGLLAAFHACYPGVQLRSTIADTDQVAHQLIAAEADIGFVGALPQGVGGLRLERLASDEIVVVLPPGHPLTQRTVLAPADLAGWPLILREEGSGTRRSVEKALAAAGQSLRREDVALVLGSTQAVLQAVAQGLGIGFASALAAAPAQAAGRLTCVRVAGLGLQRDLYLAYLPERLAEPAVAHLLAFTREHFAR